MIAHDKSFLCQERQALGVSVAGQCSVERNSVSRRVPPLDSATRRSRAHSPPAPAQPGAEGPDEETSRRQGALGPGPDDATSAPVARPAARAHTARAPAARPSARAPAVRRATVAPPARARAARPAAVDPSARAPAAIAPSARAPGLVIEQGAADVQEVPDPVGDA